MFTIAYKGRCFEIRYTEAETDVNYSISLTTETTVSETSDNLFPVPLCVTCGCYKISCILRIYCVRFISEE